VPGRARRGAGGWLGVAQQPAEAFLGEDLGHAGAVQRGALAGQPGRRSHTWTAPPGVARSPGRGCGPWPARKGWLDCPATGASPASCRQSPASKGESVSEPKPIRSGSARINGRVELHQWKWVIHFTARPTAVSAMRGNSMCSDVPTATTAGAGGSEMDSPPMEFSSGSPQSIGTQATRKTPAAPKHRRSESEPDASAGLWRTSCAEIRVSERPAGRASRRRGWVCRTGQPLAALRRHAGRRRRR